MADLSLFPAGTGLMGSRVEDEMVLSQVRDLNVLEGDLISVAKIDLVRIGIRECSRVDQLLVVLDVGEAVDGDLVLAQREVGDRIQLSRAVLTVICKDERVRPCAAGQAVAAA